jgi:hypothetical protein
VSKLILAVAVGSILAITGVVAVTSSRNRQENVKPNSLRWFAAKAKASRKDKIFIPAPVEYLGADSPPDELLSQATIVIARPVASYTSAPNDEDVVTWYKFRLVETLTEGVPCPRCPNRTPPNEILPVNTDEFLLPKYGGTLAVDGVEVTKGESDFPPFSEDKNYLLFIVKSPNGTASLLTGPSGVYAVNPEGAAEPVSNRSHPLKEAIRQRFDGSVERLKQHVKKAKEQ